MLLRDIHYNLLTQYDRKEVCAPSQSQVNEGTGTRMSSQDGVSQQEETDPLSLPHLNHLYESSFVWDENSSSNPDVVVITSGSGHPTDTQPLAELPGSQTYVCGLASN
jgi:hypothetical protein